MIANIQNSNAESAPNTFDLKLCQACAPSVYQQRFGLTPNFEKLEANFSKLNGTDGHLTYRMLKKLTDRECWNFEEFWMVPGRWRYRKHVMKTKGLFSHLLKNEKRAITVLYEIFKNIEVVSIILRFIDPKNHGIISPPVRCALKLKAKDNYVDEYIDYLLILRKHREEYGFARAADADMALWALVEKCLRSKSADCTNFKRYQEKMVDIEEQYIKKSHIFQSLEDEIIEVAEKDVEKKEEELKQVRDELQGLRTIWESMPENIIKLEKSSFLPEEKIIHDRRELAIDASQKYFMKKLAENPFIHQIIWSENITAKHPTRITNIKDDGELTLLYVSKNNYTAKLIIRPVKCPDRTHARFFASLVAREMRIPVAKEK